MSCSRRHSDYRGPNEHSDRYRSRSRHGYSNKHYDDGRKHDSRNNERRRSEKHSAKTHVSVSTSRSPKLHQSRSEKDSSKTGRIGHSDRRNIGRSDGTIGKGHEIQNNAEKHSKHSTYKSEEPTDNKTGSNTTKASKINLDKPNDSKPRSEKAKLTDSKSGSNKTKEKLRSEKNKETVTGAEKPKEKIAASESARKKTSDHRASGKESVSKSSSRSTHRIEKDSESNSRKQDSQDSVRYRDEKVINTAAHKSRTENARNHQSQGPSEKIDPVQENKPLSRENKWHSQHMYKAHLRGRGRGFRGRGYRGRGYTRYRDHRIPRGYSETNTGFNQSRPSDSRLPLDDKYRAAVDEGSYIEHTQYRERYEDSEDKSKGRIENHYSKRSDSIPRESSWDNHGSHRMERVKRNHFDEKFQEETFNRDYRREDNLLHEEQVTKERYDRTSWHGEHVESEDIQERNYQIRDRYKDDFEMSDQYVEKWSDYHRRYERHDERKHFEEKEIYYHPSRVENDDRRHFDDNTSRHEQFQAENVYGECFDEFDPKHESAVSESRHTDGAQDYYNRQTGFQRQNYKRNDIHGEKRRPFGRRPVTQNIIRGQSNSQQYYRNAKRKIVRGTGKRGMKTQRQFSSVDQHGNARIRNNRNQSQLNKRASIKQGSNVSNKRSTERTEDSQTTQQPERPKANPTVDRGASGCILKEDRPYEERQNEGFHIHMDPPLKKETASENRQKDDKNTDPLQQSVIFIPNQDFQHGPRQAIDQFGNVVQLPEAPQGALAPVPIQSHDGQEMIFIPFGSNAGLPESIVPVQQSNFPFGFLPQFVPADPMAPHQIEPKTKPQEDKSGKMTKSDGNKATNLKPLTSEQRAKMRSKLMARRKQNLVKEVEKKVIENFLDRSKSIDSKSKNSKDSSSRKSKRKSSLKNVDVSPSKAVKKDSKADIYEDVSDLEDVSEDEIEQLSDWENVSVDEIELDANERRPKFRKQNEPRTFIQHSATKRKLNVRRAPAQIFKQGEGESNPGQVYRSQTTEKTEMHSQRDHDINVNKDKAIPSNKSISKAYQDRFSGRVTKIENKRDTQSDTPVYKAYTASKISEELKRVETERMLNRNEQAMSLQDRKDRIPVQDRKTRNDSQRRRNIYESRPISPLQVTVKNNLYEKKDQSKEYEHDEEGTLGDNQIRKDTIEHASHRGASGQNLDNRFGKSRHNVTDNKQVDRNRFGNNSDSDRRIIREKGQGQSHDQYERQDISKQETFFRKMGNEETELDNNKFKNYQIGREHEKMNERETYSGMRRNIENTRADPARTGGKGDNIEVERQNTFNYSQDERNNYKKRTGHGYKPAQKFREGRRDNEDKPFSKREEPQRPDSYREGNERPIKRFKSKENPSNKDEYYQTGTEYSDHPKKRGNMYNQHDEFSDENTGRKGLFESGDEEDDFSNIYPNKRRTSEFITTDETGTILSNNSLITRPINRNETFDPSLPPIQNVPAMSAPTAPPLLDMSLPPPQLMSAQFASSPQVILQNQPVLAHQSQLQSIQQPQILGLQQSQQMQTLQRSQTGQQSTLNFQPQMAGQQQSFQQSLSQQPNMGQSDASIQPRLQLQTQNSSQQQPQQRSFQVLIDHSQPMAHQLNVTQQQNMTSQQQQQQQMNSNVQHSQSGSLNSFSSQAQNMNQPIQQSQSQIGTNPNPFQNVQQTLNTLGINQGTGMPARIVSVGQGQNVIQGQVTGQPQARGYLVPASFAGSFQGYNKGQF